MTQIGPKIQQQARDIIATERDDVQPKSETDSDQSQFMRSSERLQADQMSVEARKSGVEPRFKSKRKIRAVKKSFG